MPVNIRVWSGSRSARIVDMTNAHKIGKKCRVFYFEGCACSWSSDPIVHLSINATHDVMQEVNPTTDHEVSNDVTFDDLVARVKAKIDKHSAEGAKWISSRESEIRGVDAPREVMFHLSSDKKFSVQIDDSGVTLCALDDVNEWREITSRQSHAKAYVLARKVWDKVTKASTRYEATEILRAAGCNLHGYCGLD